MSIIFSTFALTITTSFFPVPEIKLKLIATGLTGPVSMDCPKDGSKRLFICEQTGKIKIIKKGVLLEKPFLDIGSKLDGASKIYSEKGLLGIAFHPEYKSNGKFYIYYSAPETDKKFDHKTHMFNVFSDGVTGGTGVGEQCTSKGIINIMVVNNYTFTNVTVFENYYQGGLMTNYTKYTFKNYIAKNVGIVKREQLDSNRTWNLIRYNIVQ